MSQLFTSYYDLRSLVYDWATQYISDCVNNDIGVQEIYNIEMFAESIVIRRNFNRRNMTPLRFSSKPVYELKWIDMDTKQNVSAKHEEFNQFVAQSITPKQFKLLKGLKNLERVD